MTNRTLLNVLESFEDSHLKDVSLLQSALFRFTLPGLGGKKPSGSRLTSREIAAARKTLDSISVSDETVERLRTAQRETFALLNTPKKRQRQLRYYLNQFIEWAVKNGFFSSPELAKQEKKYTFYPNKIERIKTTNRTHSCKFIFSFEVSDYTSEPLQTEEVQQHLNRIKEELNKFKRYQITNQGNRLVSVEKHELLLQLILGWLYREKRAYLAGISFSKLVPPVKPNPFTNQGNRLVTVEKHEVRLRLILRRLYREKGAYLADISFSKLVPLVKLNLSSDEFSSEENPWLSQIIAKARALEKIKQAAHDLVNLIEDFFSWLKNPPSPGTKQLYVDALIAYSKYVYRNETDKTMALNFEDIPIVNRLKVYRKELETNRKATSNSSNKYLPWSDVIKVLYKLKFEANLERIKDGNRRRKKRPLSAQAKSLQAFILLGFFTLIPPSRQRVIRELELGKTLKYGCFENGRFISFKNMPNPSQAKYYIHLQPGDYKTGDTYGEWLGEFPNVEFSDGSNFYEYLNRWLFRGYQDESGEWHGMRGLVATAEERTVFVTERTGRSHKTTSMNQKIKSIFTRWTEVPIAPHDLRHLYRTYIEDPATGATPEEKESAAYWMRHSSQMAKKTYSHLNNEQKLRAGAQMSARLNQQLLNGRKK